MNLSLPRARAFGSRGRAAGESGPLTVSGRRVLTVDGAPWFGVGASWFPGLRDWIENRDKAEAFLAWVVSRGLQWVRVMGMFNGGIGRFIPTEHADYFAAWRELVDRCAALGLRIEPVVFADAQNAPLWFDPLLFTRVAYALNGAWNVLAQSGGNEAPFNGFNPAQLTKPAGVLSARCSMGTDARPFEPVWDLAIYEGERDDQFCRKYKSVLDLYRDGITVPILVDEMIGIGEAHEGGRTTADAFACWQFTAGLKIVGAVGVCAHIRCGITGDVPAPGSNAERCVDAMVAAGRLPIGRFAFDQYERGAGPEEDRNPRLPIEHHDVEPYTNERTGFVYPGNPAGCLRTHAFIRGNQAEVIAPGPGPLWEAQPANGWRITQTFSLPGSPANVLLCER